MNTKIKTTNTVIANLILGIVALLFFISLIVFIAIGLKTGELQTKMVNPCKSTLASLIKKMEKTNSPQVRSSSTVIINNQTSVNSSTTSSVEIIQNGKRIQTISPNPTIIQFNKESMKNFCSRMPNASVCK